MKWILRIFIALAGVILLMTVAGWLLPKEHVASLMVRLNQNPDAVWSAITDAGAMPAWREGLKSVKTLPSRNGLPAWVENVSGAGDISLETTVSEPPKKLVVRIADPNLPFGGAWTYEIVPTADGCTLRITENGEVRNPIFRLLSRFDQPGTIRTYLKSLSRKFGEPARIEP